MLQRLFVFLIVAKPQQLSLLFSMVQKQLQYKDNIISYESFGSGSEYILCFHGYAQAASRWSILEPYLNPRFTLYAFDLPYHGKTQWNAVDTFTVASLVEIVKQVLPAAVKKFNLLAYSMGGRIALRLLQEIPQMITKAVLLAPDGLHRNRWYRFATHTVLGRRIFNEFKKNPKLIITVGKRLKKQGVLSEQMYNLAYYYIHDETARFLLYNRWISTRHFQPNLKLLRQIISQYHIPVEMVFAKHDKVIVADHGIEFIKGLEHQARIHIIDTGHSFLYASQAAFIASLLNEEK